MATAAHNPTTSLQPVRPLFRRTSAKKNALKIIADYFCLRPIDLARLLRNREPNEYDLRTAQRVLQQLGNWSYRRKNALLTGEGLVRRYAYFDPQTETDSHVYGLTDRGVKECGGKTFDEHSVRTLDHELELTFFHIRLKELCDILGWQLFWQQDDLKTATIDPDAYFKIGTPAGWYHFFLERERSKLSNYQDGEPSIRRKKLPAYADLFDTDKCEKEWGFRKFRVIVIQQSDERRKNLAEALQKTHATRMFWLTTEQLYKVDTGGSIFITPKDHLNKTYSFKDL